MDEVCAVDIYDETVRLVLESLLEAFVVLGIYTLMPQPEPFQRHVGTQHTYLSPLMVMDMSHIGRCQLL